MVMTTQVSSGLAPEQERADLYDAASMDAEREYYRRYQEDREEALINDLSRYDGAYDAYEALLDEQENDDYIYLRDEVVVVIEAALVNFDGEVTDADVNSLITHLRNSGHLADLPHAIVAPQIAEALAEISDIPDHEDYRAIFDTLRMRGWVS